MTRRDYLSQVLIGALLACTMLLFIPFSRLLFRLMALGYSSGNEWAYPNGDVSINVGTLAYVLALTVWIPVLSSG